MATPTLSLLQPPQIAPTPGAYNGWVPVGGGLSWGDAGQDLYWMNPATGEASYEQPTNADGSLFGTVTPEQIAALQAQWGPMAQTIAELQAQGWTNLRPAPEGLYTAPGSGAFVTLIGDHPYHGTNTAAAIHEEGTDTDFNDFAQTFGTMLATGALGSYLSGADLAATGAEGATTAETATSVYPTAYDQSYVAGNSLYGSGYNAANTGNLYNETSLYGDAGTDTLANQGVGDAGSFDQAGNVNYQSPPIESTFTPTSGATNPYTGAPTGGPSASNWLSTQTGIDPGLLQLGGTAASTLLGVYGANQQANALEGISNAENARLQQLFNAGAPYRAQLETLMANPAAYLQSPLAQASVQQGTNALARALSVNGNPAGSGAALHELQNYATNGFANDFYRQASLLGGLGGLSQFAAGAAQGPNLAPQLAGVNAEGSMYNTLGAGISNLTQPRTNWDQIFRNFGSRNPNGL